MRINNVYKDITRKFQRRKRKYRVYEKTYYKKSGVYFKVDNKNVVLDYAAEEKETAKIISKITGKTVYMNPRINFPKGIKTADYIISGKYWDKKLIKNAISKERAIDNAVKNCMNQSNRFIIDATNCKLSNTNLIIQAKNLLNKRLWIKEIIIIRNNKVIIALKKIRRLTYHPYSG